MSKVYTKKINKNILTGRRQRLIKNFLYYIANIEESQKEKPKTNTDHHNGDLNACFFFKYLI